MARMSASNNTFFILSVLAIGMDHPMMSSWECIAIDGRRVKHGENFVAGADYCTVCKCEKGEAKFCRAALCQQPQDCRSFRAGDSCCDFICLDDILPTRNNGVLADTGLRMVASAITAILSLSLLLFLIHRLRQRKLRTAQHQYFEDQIDSMGGGIPDGYQNNSCCHNTMYLTGNDHIDFFLDGYTPPYSTWKPPPYYFPQREAPPSYNEAVANDNAPNRLPSLSPLMVELNSSFHNNPNRLSSSLHNSVILSEELLHRTNEGADTLAPQTDPVQNSALLSDQLYEQTSGSHEREVNESRRSSSVRDGESADSALNEPHECYQSTIDSSKSFQQTQLHGRDSITAVGGPSHTLSVISTSSASSFESSNPGNGETRC